MVTLADLVREVEREVNDIVGILCDLIRIPTVNPPGENYEQFCKHVQEMLSSWGIRTRLIRVPEDYVAKFYPDYRNYPRYILIAELGSGKPVLHFNGHYDVVPPGTGWTVTQPFEPKIVNNRVYGRGSCDMKGGIAVCLYVLKKLIKLESRLTGKVELALVPDEEIGGETGTGYLIRELGVRPDYVIVAEPSSSGKVLIGNKGLVWLLVEVFGKQAHGSTPWLGVNAFELGVKLAAAIMDDLKRITESRVSRYEYDIEGGNKATINFGGEVRSAGKINVVPGYFAFSIDRRVIPEENVDEVERELIEYIKAKARELGIQVDIKVVQKSPPALTSPDAELVKKLEEAAREVLGKDLRKVVCTGGLDTRYYQAAGIQAVTYGPGEASCAHMADEFVEVEELVRVAKVYLKLCEKLGIVS